jgi:hypothetical protein
VHVYPTNTNKSNLELYKNSELKGIIPGKEVVEKGVAEKLPNSAF